MLTACLNLNCQLLQKFESNAKCKNTFADSKTLIHFVVTLTPELAQCGMTELNRRGDEHRFYQRPFRTWSYGSEVSNGHRNHGDTRLWEEVRQARVDSWKDHYCFISRRPLWWLKQYNFVFTFRRSAFNLLSNVLLPRLKAGLHVSFSDRLLALKYHSTEFQKRRNDDLLYYSPVLVRASAKKTGKD